ncbi:F-box/kelch-repeat protein [Ananas comosus]|uniref:F-box/kelch-repeat protein n=1 Tax=Ananas comosus TaxID=4615 RepID=A0A199VAF7_ANACO|nr:F-box/kelch-repeat protein [Ananas comosus]
MAFTPPHSYPKTSSSSSSSTSPSQTLTLTLTHLPDDPLLSILRLLPAPSLLALSATCRRLRRLAAADALWEHLFRRDWGDAAADALLPSSSSSSSSSGDGGGKRRGVAWRRLYQQVSQLGSLSCRRLSLSGGGGASPRPRASLSLNFVAGWLVLFGGGCEGGRHLDDTWVAYIGNGFDRVLSWQKLNSGIPTGRFGHTCALVGNCLVLFGGINDSGLRLNDTWIGEIDLRRPLEINISWRLLDVDSVLPPPRGAHAACSIGDRTMAIHGGIALDGRRLSDTWLLDLSEGFTSGNWHQLLNPCPMPPPRSGHTLTSIDETLMVLFGGRGSGYEVLNDLWLFDASKGYPEWKEIDMLDEMPPLPRVGHSATLILGSKILIYGGEDSQRHRKDDFWVLEAANLLKLRPDSMKTRKKMWKKLSVEGQSPNCRSFHGACADRSGRYVYVFGGMVDGVVHPAEAYGLRFDGDLYHVELMLQL